MKYFRTSRFLPHRKILFALVGALGVLTLVASYLPEEQEDAVTTTMASSQPSSQSAPHCLFRCSELLRADSTWPTVTTIKSSCKKIGKPSSCPSLHPKVRKKHAHTSLSREASKLYYVWVEEYYCCKE